MLGVIGGTGLVDAFAALGRGERHELDTPCPTLRTALVGVAPSNGARLHDRGTCVCLEGPQFSSRAESDLHHSWGGDPIGMTLMPETKLAREAKMCHAAVALVTDDDCWRQHPASVNKLRWIEDIIANQKVATENAMALIHVAIPAIAGAVFGAACSCQFSLAFGILSDRSKINAATRERLSPLLRRYLEKRQ